MANAEIDALTLRISSDTSNANRALDGLVERLQTLQSSLLMFSASGKEAQGVGNNIKHIAEASKGIDANSIQRASRSLKTLSSAIDSFKGKDSQQAVSTLTHIATGLRAFDGLNIPEMKNLSGLSTAINSLGSSKSTSATKNIQGMSGSLYGLGTAMRNISGADFDATSMSTFANSVGQLGKASVTKAVNNIQALTPALEKAIPQFRALGNLGSADSILNIASAISRLGGVNAERAITLLPQITDGLVKMLETLKSVGSIDSSIVDSLQAIASVLASVGASSLQASQKLNTLQKAFLGLDKTLGKAGKEIGTKLKTIFTGIIHPMRSVGLAFRQLQSSIGRFYGTVFIFVRVFRRLWSAIESAMSYIEVFNYFKSAFDVIGEKANSQMAELGKSGAIAYAEAFEENVTSLTEKMTGYLMDETSGSLSFNSAGVNLGIDISSLMNAQTRFGQMANSIGSTSEQALTLSRVLTEIGADLASVKNMDFEDVWDNLASGMVGMSRAVDKYGINIRTAGLQETLYNLGIDTTVAKLSQADKVILRTITILQSSEYAWGDLSDTLSLPANQLRVLKANFANLARSIGNIFLPMVAKVLPWINALVTAFRRLADFIVKLLGFDGFEWGGSSGADNSGISDLLDETDSLGDSLDSASDSAKALKRQLRGFDELNNLTSDTSSGSSGSGGSGSGVSGSGLLDTALSDIVSKYQEAWNTAFDGVTTGALGIADTIAEAYAEEGLTGVGNAISTAISDALESIDWESVYSVASNFGTGLGDFLNGLITEDLFGDIGSTIAGALNTAIYATLSLGETIDWENVGSSLAEGLTDFFTDLDFEALGADIHAWISGIVTAVTTFLKKADWGELLDGIGDILDGLTTGDKAIIFTLLFGIPLFKAGASVTAEAIHTAIVKKLVEVLGGLAGTAVGTGASAGTMTATTAGGLLSIALPIAIALAVGVIGSYLVINNAEELTEIFGDAKNALENTVEENPSIFQLDMDMPVNPTPVITDEKKKEVADKIVGIAKDMATVGANAFVSSSSTPTIQFDLDGRVTPESTKRVKTWVDDNVPKTMSIDATLKRTWQRSSTTGWWADNRPAVNSLTANLKRNWSVKSSTGWFSDNKPNTSPLYVGLKRNYNINKTTGWFTENTPKTNPLTVGLTRNYSISKSDGWFTENKPVTSNLSTGLSAGWDSSTWWNNNKPAVGDLSTTLKVNKPTITASVSTRKTDALLWQKLGFSGTPQIDINYFKKGGFLDDLGKGSLFMAGENGVPEMMGTIGGKNAVASGTEITGISDSIYDTSGQQIGYLREQNSLLRQLLQKNFGISADEVFNATKSKAQQYYNRTGRNALVY